MADGRDERDADGNLTPWALACDALSNAGCDCGLDEPGSCPMCACERAMKTERARAERAEAALRAIRDYEIELVPDLSPGNRADCPECQHARERKWPPSLTCNAHYKEQRHVNQENLAREATQHWTMRRIAREALEP